MTDRIVFLTTRAGNKYFVTDVNEVSIDAVDNGWFRISSTDKETPGTIWVPGEAVDSLMTMTDEQIAALQTQEADASDPEDPTTE